MRKKKLQKMFDKLYEAIDMQFKATHQFVEDITQDLQNDYICGHWVHQKNSCRATVYKLTTGYQLVIFKNKRVMTERHNIIVRGTQLFLNCAEGRTPEQVVHFRDTASLVLGSYGLFLRDDFTEPNE